VAESALAGSCYCGGNCVQTTVAFLDALTSTITSFGTHDGLVLLGDFNINTLEPNSSNCKLLTQFLYSVGLNQVVNEPTHYTAHSHSLIDVVCTDLQIDCLHLTQTPDLGGHAMVTAALKIKKNRPTPHWISYRPIKNIIPEQLNVDLNAIDWGCVNGLNCVNSMVEAFTLCIVGLFDLHAPIIRRKIKYPPHPWITDTIRTMMHMRNKYHKKHRKHNTEADRDSYRRMRQIVTAAIESEKRTYFSTHITANINNSKKLWRNLKNTVLLDSKHNTELPPFFNDPHLINSHFLSVPGNDNVTISQLSYFEHHRHSAATFSFKAVDERVVLNTIKRLKSNAQDNDNISLEMLKLTLPQTLVTITAITNQSLDECAFPTYWKLAVVRPLPKRSDPTTVHDLC
jgi:hypothetical protein